MKKENVFAIGDLHLDHANIIRYCNRPFSSVDEMNRVITDNWNKTVREEDTVYFLGDLSFGKGSKKADYWVDKLKGNVVFIKGNHDRSKSINFLEKAIIEYNGYQFLILHDSRNKPENWKGWIIHGHHHNNHMDEFPFINGKKKTINVSAELINYTPLSMDFFVNINLNKIEWMEEINGEVIYKNGLG